MTFNRNQFRYLLMMHEVLEGGVTDSEFKEYLQRRIKEACMGLIEWYYDAAEEHSYGGWNLDYHPSGKAFGIDDSQGEHRSAYPILLLYEFLRTFPQEQDFILQKIEGGRLVGWLEGLKEQRDKKSGVWVWKESDHRVEWDDRDHREEEQIKVPHFRLSSLVGIWRALQFLQKISEKRESKEPGINPPTHGHFGDHLLVANSTLPASISFTRRRSISNATSDVDSKEVASQDGDLDPAVKDPLEEINGKLSEKCRNDIQRGLEELAAAGIRSKIIERFTIKPQGSTDSDPRTMKTRLAVCRSACSSEPRTHFHASDTILFDAVEWGFFDDESPDGILPAWTETIGIQDKTDKDWQVPLRYAIALRMASQDQSEKKENLFVETKNIPVGIRDEVPTPGKQEGRDKSSGKGESRPPPKEAGQRKQLREKRGKLQRIRETLMQSVLSNGLFAHELDIYKRPLSNLVYASSYRRHHIPRILLRLDLPNLTR